MRLSDIEHFRDLLMERDGALKALLSPDSARYCCDRTKVRELLTQIRDALDRINEETYGHCRVCHGKMELHRLGYQPVSQVCLDCISDAEKAVLEEDLYLASKIHRALLPQAVPDIDGFEVSVRSLAAGSVGGDYYDFLPGNGHRSSRVVIADAMGKGIRAGMLMSNLQGILRVLSSDIDLPGPLTMRLNQWLCRNMPVTKFVSLACLNLEATAGEKTQLTYVNAGHCPPILIRNDCSVELLEPTGGVLGVHEDFDYEERNLTLQSGDFLMLYTDGITEAANAGGEMYEENRLIEYVCSHRTDKFDGFIDSLIDNVLHFSEAQQVEDDLTVIILRKK